MTGPLSEALIRKSSDYHCFACYDRAPRIVLLFFNYFTYVVASKHIFLRKNKLSVFRKRNIEHISADMDAVPVHCIHI